MSVTSYRVDSDLRIVDVGGDWEGFAERNDGQDLYPDRVIGTRLLSWIADDHTKMWVEAVIQKAIIRNSVKRRYRCDSEDTVRELEMLARKDPEGSISVFNTTVSETKRSHTVLISSDRHLDASPALRCSICNKIRIDGAWFDPFSLERDQSYTVTHIVCGECYLIALS